MKALVICSFLVSACYLFINGHINGHPIPGGWCLFGAIASI